jgi:hypothetical protein
VVAVSGSRLPGDEESNDRHDADVRAETRLSGDLAERFEAFQSEHGVSNADLLRDALREYLPSLDEDGPEYVRPSDEDLARAYRALAVDRKRVIAVPKAVDVLSQTTHPHTAKDQLRGQVLPSLEQTGLIAVRAGQVAVHPLTPVEEVDL